MIEDDMQAELMLDDCDEDAPLFDSASAHGFGPVFTEYRGDPEGAIARLLKEGRGEAVAVATIHGLGAVDLVYGDDKMGVKKMAARHPEFRRKLPMLLRSGRLVTGPDRPNRAYLVDDGTPRHVTAIRLDWHGARKLWIVTSYDLVDEESKFGRWLALMDTERPAKKDSVGVDCRPHADQTSNATLDHSMSFVKHSCKPFDHGALDDVQAALFDSVALSPMERLKLAQELDGLRRSAESAGPLEKLRLVRRLIEIRALLAGDAEPAGGTAEEPAGDVSSSPDDELSDDPNSPNYRYKDTGYIAGSRKEKAADQIRLARESGERVRATSVDWDAIEENPRQAADLITKANLFGQTDWDKLKADGVEPGAAFLISKIYSAIGTQPETQSAQARKDFAFGLETIRDRLEPRKTAKDVLEALKEIRDELNGSQLSSDEADRYAALMEQSKALRAQEEAERKVWDELYAQYNRLNMAHSSAKREVSKREDRKWKVDQSLRDAVTAAKAAVDAFEPKLEVGREAALRSRAIGEKRSDIYRQAAEIERVSRLRNTIQNPVTRAWVTFGKKFFALLNYRSASKGSDAFAGHVTNVLSGKVTDWAWADPERKTTVKTATKQEISFQLQVVDDFERVGGRDLRAHSTTALKDMLGFRDVQSGNWVLKDPNSAKFHVEQTAGAMCDMADLLGVDPKAVGFGGRLGMAFGARGSGGKNAPRAHYEPTSVTINLTKMGGGGALGHEWAHALDNVVHEIVNEKVSGEKDAFVSLKPELFPPGVLRSAISAVRDAMLKGDVPSWEVIKFTEQDLKTAKLNLDNPTRDFPKAIRDAGSSEAAVKVVDAKYPPESYYAKHGKKWRKLAAAYHADPGKTQVTIRTGPKKSSYFVESQFLDNGVAGKYWSAPEEMFARSFQAWSEDRLRAMGRRNDYLSAKADNKHYYDPIFGQLNPFPEGAERERINAALDSFVGALRSEKVFDKVLSKGGLMDSIFGIAAGQVGMFDDE